MLRLAFTVAAVGWTVLGTVAYAASTALAVGAERCMAMVKPQNVTCPSCGGPMVSRVNVERQQRFWGCQSFPRCRGTRDTDGLSKAEREAERGDRR